MGWTCQTWCSNGDAVSLLVEGGQQADMLMVALLKAW